MTTSVAPRVVDVAALTDAELWEEITATRGWVPLDCTDPRVEALALDGRIVPGGGRWRPNPHWQPDLTPELRDYLAEDQRHVRSDDR